MLALGILVQIEYFMIITYPYYSYDMNKVESAEKGKLLKTNAAWRENPSTISFQTNLIKRLHVKVFCKVKL